MSVLEAKHDSSDLRQDIAAASAELKSRCDQVVADSEERQRQLAELATEVSSNSASVDVRSVQARIRQLLNERGVVSATARAGRTTIGLTVPGLKTQGATSAPRTAVSTKPPTMDSALRKAAELVEQRLLAVLMAARGAADRGGNGELRVELSLLTHLVRSIAKQLAQVPDDPVLLSALREFADDVRVSLAALEAGGAARARVLLDHVQFLTAQAAALGGRNHGKEHVQKARGQLAHNRSDLALVNKEMLVAFAQASAEIERCSPLTNLSLLDELLRAGSPSV
jgi:hypothetical protein